MAKLDVEAVVLFLLRMGPAIFFVLFMMLLFFSFKVDVRENSMERFVFELSDSVTSDTNFVADKSIFSPSKMTAAEKENNERYAQNCDFGYQIDITAKSGSAKCGNDNECSGFCGSVCGIDSGSLSLGRAGNCNCNIELIGNNFCECKKSDEWQDNYKWRLGYMPTSIAQASAEFPAGIELDDTALPAAMRITAYDSFLTRLSCATAKSYHLKKKFGIRFDVAQISGATAFKRSGAGGTDVCLFSGPDIIGGQCRYLPNVPVEDFNIITSVLSLTDSNTARGKITAYPLKASATCDEIKTNPSALAGETDQVNKIILCLEKV